MAIKMVREPSETPNINNIDDIIPMRYAYGGQNGYVIGKGNEISNSVSGLNFTVNSGRLVLQGVECDIDATGVTITIDNIATKRYYTVYLEVNLGLNTATIKSEYDTATYPTIDAGDDLTENSTGIARMVLYKFTATSGIISEVNKVVKSVKYAVDVKVNNAINSDKVNNLEIKQDENGVIKIGEIIIPQKKLLWEGDLQSSYNTPVVFNLDDIRIDDIIEVEWYLTFDGETTKAISQGIVVEDPDNDYSIKISFPAIVANVGISSNKFLGLEGVYWSDGSLLFYRVISHDGVVHWYPHITKIYKIIQ